MKAITLTQPWATLIAVGAKHIETRSWATSYRGPLAIHAAKGISSIGSAKGLMHLCRSEPFRSALLAAGYLGTPALPRGAIVATCELLDCVETWPKWATITPWLTASWNETTYHVPPGKGSHEHAFGDYTPGRYAWLLGNVPPPASRSKCQPVPRADGGLIYCSMDVRQGLAHRGTMNGPARFPPVCVMSLVIDTTHPSPNHESRNGAAITMLVLHATAGSFASARAWLTNPDSRVSSHYLLAKNGVCSQLVQDADAAWHAGQSSWRGMDSVQIQNHSLGVEIANLNDGFDVYPPGQLAALKTLCISLIEKYHILPTMVVRHLDIAPGRKTDPAGFPDWPGFVASLYPPAPVAYRAMGIPIYQRSDHTGALAGYLIPGEHVVIDDPTNNHLQDARGFLKDRDGLEKL